MLKSWLRTAAMVGLAATVLLFGAAPALAAICPVCGLDTSVPVCPGYRVGDGNPWEAARRSGVGVRLVEPELRGSLFGGVEGRAAIETPWVLDVAALKGRPADLRPLLLRTSRFKGSINVTTRPEGAAARWAELPNWTRLQVVSDGARLSRVRGYGKAADRLLGGRFGLNVGEPGGRVLRFELSHEPGDLAFVRGLRARAINGEFAGQHLAVGICEVDLEELIALQDEVMAHGGLSCIIPVGPLDVQPMALAARELSLNPALLDGATPREALFRGYDAALRKVAGCFRRGDLGTLRTLTVDQNALSAAFDADSLQLFTEGGVVKDEVVIRVFHGLARNRFMLIEFVDAGRRSPEGSVA